MWIYLLYVSEILPIIYFQKARSHLLIYDVYAYELLLVGTRVLY